MAAASSNLLLVVLLPFALAGWVLWLRRTWAGDPTSAAPSYLQRHGRLVAVTAAVVTVAFTVLRNTAWGSWLAP